MQKYSMGNNRHPNVFFGMRAPELVKSTTSIGNHTKSVTLNPLFLRNKTILASVNGPAPQFQKTNLLVRHMKHLKKFNSLI